VLGLPCHPELAALPEPVEHVVFCVADRRVEAVLEAAIAHGARAATLMSQLVVDGDPGLAERLRGRVRSAGLLLCGPNGMGFYNARDGVWVCGFDTRENHPRKGAVTLISQSGAGMSGIVDCEERIDFGLAVSTGSEFTVGLADYLDFALETQAPKVIGLFMDKSQFFDSYITAWIYVLDGLPKPVKLGSQAIQDFFAYDFYTAKLYRVTIVAVVGIVSRIIDWMDRFIVDGFVNLVGLATVFSGQSLRYNVTGQTQFYALTILLGIILLLSVLSFGLF